MDLSIVIVNWNTRDILRECLMLLPTAAGTLSYEIIIVDNGSQDGSVQMITSDFPEVQLLENIENLGFPKAVNQGIEASSGDFVALVNSDIMVPNGALSKLVSHLERNEKLAAAGPQLVSPGSHLQYSGGFAPSPMSAFNQLVGVHALLGGRTRGLFVRSRKAKAMLVDWLCAACLVVRRSAIEEVGPLDDSHFMYAEDVEFCLRMQRYGWQLCFLPEIRVIHYGGASSDGISEIKLLGLAGVFRIAAGTLSRLSYTLFGVLMAASYFQRYILISVGNLIVNNRTFDEVASSRDLKKFASTSWLLGLRGPKYARDFCADLENASHNATLQSPK